MLSMGSASSYPTSLGFIYRKQILGVQFLRRPRHVFGHLPRPVPWGGQASQQMDPTQVASSDFFPTFGFNRPVFDGAKWAVRPL